MQLTNKPHIRRLPRTGDAETYWVEYDGHGERVMISSAMMSVYGLHPLKLLYYEINRRFKPMDDVVSRLC
jgi:hypothetical protein